MHVTAINGLIDGISLTPFSDDSSAMERQDCLRIEEDSGFGYSGNPFCEGLQPSPLSSVTGCQLDEWTHGLLLYKGKYHIFNQKNASAIFLGQINWGHFSSPDMLNSTEEKPALTPDAAYDKNGIWSGHAVINDDGIPQLIYTAGGDKMGVGIAFPKDTALIEWEKYAGNPVIARSLPDIPVRTCVTSMSGKRVMSGI